MSPEAVLSGLSLEVFRQWWEDAEYVFIGAGAGLSAAAGIDYTDEADFAGVFPVMAREGFRARYQLIGYERHTPQRHWAYWATHVNNVRFGQRVHPVYECLRAICADKDTFVLTSNVDAMFPRNGFDAERLFTPQGDYAAMQCRKPCKRLVWPSKPAIDLALACIDPERFELTDLTAIPRCPWCGGDVFLNVRIDKGFVNEPYQDQLERMQEWLARAHNARLLLLEIGAGYNTPMVVRWPMERLAKSLPGARLVRINRDEPEPGEAPPDRVLTLAADAGLALRALHRVCARGAQ